MAEPLTKQAKEYHDKWQKAEKKLTEAKEILREFNDRKPMPYKCLFCYESSTNYDNHEEHCPFTKALVFLTSY